MRRGMGLNLLVLSLCCMLPDQGVDAACAVICTADYRPVCGTDFKTYGNLCNLRAADCLSNSTISKRYDGECSCVGNAVCTKEYHPHCGSDGQTYSNQCYFNYAKLCSSGLSLSRLGECPSTTTIITTATNSPECDIVCAEVYDPVCGTDYNTYSNMCTLSIKQCQRPELNLQLLRKGICDTANGTSSPLTMIPTTVFVMMVSMFIWMME